MNVQGADFERRVGCLHIALLGCLLAGLGQPAHSQDVTNGPRGKKTYAGRYNVNPVLNFENDVEAKRPSCGSSFDLNCHSNPLRQLPSIDLDIKGIEKSSDLMMAQTSESACLCADCIQNAPKVVDAERPLPGPNGTTVMEKYQRKLELEELDGDAMEAKNPEITWGKLPWEASHLIFFIEDMKDKAYEQIGFPCPEVGPNATRVFKAGKTGQKVTLKAGQVAASSAGPWYFPVDEEGSKPQDGTYDVTEATETKVVVQQTGMAGTFEYKFNNPKEKKLPPCNISAPDYNASNASNCSEPCFPRVETKMFENPYTLLYMLWDVPVNSTNYKLPVGYDAAKGGVEGQNDYGRIGYAGPCPAVNGLFNGTHGYRLNVLATDTIVDLPVLGTRPLDIYRKVHPHIVAFGSTNFFYTRAPPIPVDAWLLPQPSPDANISNMSTAQQKA